MEPLPRADGAESRWPFDASASDSAVSSATADDDAPHMMDHYGAADCEPLAVCPDGSVLVNPTEEALARFEAVYLR